MMRLATMRKGEALAKLELDGLANLGNEMISVYEKNKKDFKLAMGLVLLEARERFKEDIEFGKWREANFAPLFSKERATEAMNFARFFRDREYENLGLSVCYKLSAPIHAAYADEVYKELIAMEGKPSNDLTEAMLAQARNRLEHNGKPEPSTATGTSKPESPEPKPAVKPQPDPEVEMDAAALKLNKKKLREFYDRLIDGLELEDHDKADMLFYTTEEALKKHGEQGCMDMMTQIAMNPSDAPEPDEEEEDYERDLPPPPASATAFTCFARALGMMDDETVYKIVKYVRQMYHPDKGVEVNADVTALLNEAADNYRKSFGE